MAKQQPQPQARRAPAARPGQQTQTTQRTAPVRKTSERSTTSFFSRGDREMIFGRKNYIIWGIGLLSMLIGLVAMMGGAMPSLDVWDDSIIYNHRIITFAPIMILLGVACLIYGIFARDNSKQIIEAVLTNNTEA